MVVRGAKEKIAKEVAAWAGVNASEHRLGGVEFRVGRRELGHVHGDYQVDMPLPMKVRDQLISERKAEPHHILPESGWITLRFRDSDDVDRAINLFRLSYDLARGKNAGEHPRAEESSR